MKNWLFYCHVTVLYNQNREALTVKFSFDRSLSLILRDTVEAFLLPCYYHTNYTDYQWT